MNEPHFHAGDSSPCSKHQVKHRKGGYPSCRKPEKPGYTTKQILAWNRRRKPLIRSLSKNSKPAKLSKKPMSVVGAWASLNKDGSIHELFLHPSRIAVENSTPLKVVRVRIVRDEPTGRGKR